MLDVVVSSDSYEFGYLVPRQEFEKFVRTTVARIFGSNDYLDQPVELTEDDVNLHHFRYGKHGYSTATGVSVFVNVIYNDYPTVIENIQSRLIEVKREVANHLKFTKEQAQIGVRVRFTPVSDGYEV